MKIIYNTVIPFKGFLAVNLFTVLFVRRELKDKMTVVDINHEEIHSAQMRELLFVGFYVIYFLEWLFRVLFTKDAFSHNAYRHISFEQESFHYERDFHYIDRRKPFAMWR